MQRARRFAAVVVLAVVGVSVLAGCRTEPKVAAYIGSTKITQAQVDRIIDNARTTGQAAIDAAVKQAEDRGQKVDHSKLPEPTLPSRDDVVSALVLKDVASKLAGEQNLKREDIPTEQLAQQLNMPVEATYVQLQSQLRSYLSPIFEKAQPVQATQADLRMIYERARKAGEAWASQPFEAVVKDLDGDQVRQALGVRKVLADAVDKADVKVNPQYRPLEFPILSFASGQSAVFIPLEGDTGEPAVVNAG